MRFRPGARRDALLVVILAVLTTLPLASAGCGPDGRTGGAQGEADLDLEVSRFIASYGLAALRGLPGFGTGP